MTQKDTSIDQVIAKIIRHFRHEVFLCLHGASYGTRLKGRAPPVEFNRAE